MRTQKRGVFAGIAAILLTGIGLLFLQTTPTHAANSVLAYWKFDESTAGSPAVDESGNGNSLTAFNNPQPSTDRPSELNTAFSDPYSTQLDSASGRYFAMDDTASLDATASGVSIGVWVKFSSVDSTYQSIVSKWDIGARQQWTLQLNANNKIGWWTGDGATNADNLESSSTMSAGTWYHIIVTSEGLTKKIYINGTLEGSKTSGVSMGVASGVGVGVGAKTAGSPEYLNGLVDDLRIYSYALSDSEASELAGGADVQPTPALTGSTPLTNEQGSTAAITNLQVQGGTNNPTVTAKLFVSHGTISMSTVTGLTFYNASGSTLGSQPSNTSELQFGGTLSNVNTALASLRYTRSSGTGTDTLSASLVQPGEVFFSGNNHLYEYYPGPVNWSQAKTNAQGLTKYGAQGYLATITSQSENDFIKDRLKSDSWIGASDSTTEGTWKWVTGPENGQQFWQGTGSGAIINSMYAHWNNPTTGGTGVEPNQSGDEDCAEFYYSNNGLWNDLACTSTLGYIVEFGAPGNLPTVSSKDISITTTADTTPPTAPGKPSATTPTTDTTPTVSWTASTDSGTGLKNPAYTLEWSTSATFASTTDSTTTNSTSQVPLSGLADGTWYFRVKATDAANNVATSAISDPVIIDTTNPTVPGTPSTASLWTNDNTPTFDWAASSDAGAGLGFIAYAVEWSQDTGFSGLGGTAGITENTYTIPDDLSMTDGTWYFRVASIDALGHQSVWAPYATVHIDTTVPIISDVTATDGMSTGQETIAWTTDKDTSSKVSYGPTATLGTVTSETDTSPRIQHHSMALSSLIPCSIYHYTVTSKDIAGNTVTSTDGSFITLGCAGAANVVSYADQPIARTSGGTVNLDTATVSIPSGFASVDADFQIKKIEDDPALDAIGTPTGMLLVGTQVYDIKALQNGTTAITSFNQPITITLKYTGEDIATLNEPSLVIYRWDSGTGWAKLDNCTVNSGNKTVSCTTTHFSTFALYGQAKQPSYATDNGNGASGGTANLAKRGAAASNKQTVAAKEAGPASISNIDNSNTTNSAAATTLQDSGHKTGQKGLGSQNAKATSATTWWWLLIPTTAIFIWWFIAAKRRHKKQTDS